MPTHAPPEFVPDILTDTATMEFTTGLAMMGLLFGTPLSWNWPIAWMPARKKTAVSSPNYTPRKKTGGRRSLWGSRMLDGLGLSGKNKNWQTKTRSPKQLFPLWTEPQREQQECQIWEEREIAQTALLFIKINGIGAKT